MTERLLRERTKDVLADQIRWTHSFFDRARGLIGRPELVTGEALIIDRASQVHTFFVRSAIDVVFCDPAWTVLHVVSPMQRRRLSRWVPGARWTVELPPGTASGLDPGEVLKLER